MSSWNSTRHRLLSKRVFTISAKAKKQFARLLNNLHRDLKPVGTVEAEKIAYEYWRLGLAASYETSEFINARPFGRTPIERIVKYQSTVNRQLYQAINELERLQRLRKGDNVPAPVNVQILHDGLTFPDKELTGQ